MNSRFMRIISIFGIILLLTLQYFWLQNAYRMVERDLMEKSKDCLREAIEEEILIRTEYSKPEIMNAEEYGKKQKDYKEVCSIEIENSKFLKIGMQDLFEKMDNPCSITRVDSIFQTILDEKIGRIPKYKLRIINDSIRYKKTKQLLSSNYSSISLSENSKDQKKFFSTDDLFIGNNIFIKLTSDKSVELVVTSPFISVISKARKIFFVSIFLVILLGLILVFQYKSMIRDKKFALFLKDFSRVLAHELRTPINNTYTLISTILSKNFTDSIQIENYQKETLNQCSKMYLSIDNILLIAKSELSKIQVLKTYTDMRPFIEEIVDKYRDRFYMSKTVNIETDYLSEDCKAFIDKDLMENAVVNLIENAIKYSYKQVIIRITCSVENKHLILKVKDNGVGITEKNLKSIFRIFKRGSNMDYKQIKGFGIGLFFVQKVVKAHKGMIKVSSIEDLGTEFSIDIPSKFS